MTQKNTKPTKPLIIGGAVACALVLAGGFWMGTHPAKEPFYGVMQAKTVDVAARSPDGLNRLSFTRATMSVSVKP